MEKEMEKKDETLPLIEQLRQTSKERQREMDESAPFSPEFWKSKLSQLQDGMKEQSQKGKTEVIYPSILGSWWRDRGITQHYPVYLDKVEKWAIQQGFQVSRLSLDSKGLKISWK